MFRVFCQIGLPGSRCLVALVNGLSLSLEHLQVLVWVGRLKTRDWKTRDGQNCRTGKRETGKRGTKLQDWKTRDWKTRHQTAGLENAGKGIYGKPNGVIRM